MCPAGTVEGDPGIHQIMVFSYGQCTAVDVEYQIEISDARVGSTLTLTMDNVDRFENLAFTDQRIELAGCAALLTEGSSDDVEVCLPDQDDESSGEGDPHDSSDTATDAEDTAEGDSGAPEPAEHSGSDGAPDTATESAAGVEEHAEDTAR